jgi:integrase
MSLEMKREGLPLSTPVFDVPKQLVKTLDRDLKVADIPKVDDRGRSVDVHALRHTFGTLLSVGGVAPRTAQQAMRHSDIKLTMNTYTRCSMSRGLSMRCRCCG